MKRLMDKNNANLVMGLALSGDSELRATAHDDGSVKLGNPATGEERTLGRGKVGEAKVWRVTDILKPSPSSDRPGSRGKA